MEDNSMCVQTSAIIAAYRQISDSCCEMSTSPEGISVVCLFVLLLFFCVFCFSKEAYVLFANKIYIL